MGPVPIVLQARTGSRRLPGKALASIAGRPMLQHCMERLLRAGTGPVILATTTSRNDDVLADLADGLGVRVVRGPEDDVLQRFVVAADYLHARFLVRATGDNPAVDIDAPARVVEALAATAADHVVECGLPLGAAVEGIRTAALYEAAAATREPYDREHVTPYLYRTPGRFRAEKPLAPRALRRPDLRLTVDTPEDLVFVREVLELAGTGENGGASLAEIIAAADRVLETAGSRQLAADHGRV